MNNFMLVNLKFYTKWRNFYKNPSNTVKKEIKMKNLIH